MQTTSSSAPAVPSPPRLGWGSGWGWGWPPRPPTPHLPPPPPVWPPVAPTAVCLTLSGKEGPIKCALTPLISIIMVIIRNNHANSSIIVIATSCYLTHNHCNNCLHCAYQSVSVRKEFYHSSGSEAYEVGLHVVPHKMCMHKEHSPNKTYMLPNCQSVIVVSKILNEAKNRCQDLCWCGVASLFHHPETVSDLLDTILTSRFSSLWFAVRLVPRSPLERRISSPSLSLCRVRTATPHLPQWQQAMTKAQVSEAWINILLKWVQSHTV